MLLKRVFVLGMVFAATVFIAAAPAAAKKKSKRQVTSVATSTGTISGVNETKSFTATCPPGAVALGGGLSAVPGFGDDPNSFGVSIVASQRSGKNAWSVTGTLADNNANPPAVHTVTAQAFCRTNFKRPVTEVRAATNVPVAFGDTATAACPEGTTAISGGFVGPPLALTSIQGLFITSSRRSSPSSWQARATNFTAFDLPLTAIVYCLGGKSKGKPKVTELAGPSVALPVSGVHVLSTAPPARPVRRWWPAASRGPRSTRSPS